MVKTHLQADRVLDIRRSLALLHSPGSVFELRALHCGRVKTISGYFDDLNVAVEACLELDRYKPAGVYCTLNSCHSALLARAANRLIENPERTTTDDEIVRRQWLFIDIDSDQPAGISATDEEKLATRNLAAEIEDTLRQRGWSYPLIVDSGNGTYLLYKIDMPNDAATAALLKTFYQGLNSLLGPCDDAHIDVGVFNASRILRVGGTWNRKGDNVADRPHRLCVYHTPIEECPVYVIPVQLVQDVAALAPQPAAPAQRHNANTFGLRIPGAKPSNGRSYDRKLDVERYLQTHGIEFKIKRLSNATAYLVPCPFDDNHGANGEAAVYQSDTGLLTFECKHHHCNGRQWVDYRTAIGLPDADHRDPPVHSANSQQTKADKQDKAPAEPLRFTQLLDSRAFLAMDLRPRFLVRGVLVQGQPAVVGGRSKSLKTSITADLVVSLASGSPFLGRFETVRSRVAFLSGESGAATLRETALRIALAKNAEFADLPIMWGFELPKLSRHDHLEAIGEMIGLHSLDVLVLDPLYLCLLSPELAGAASNLFAMGTALAPLSEIGQQTGATIVVLHHFRKSGQSDPDEPAALEELAQSGVAEWARQWVLLQRRQPYQADGTHSLWMRCGGSFGHAGLWALDVDEGLLDADTMTGRHWDVSVKPVRDAKAESEALAKAKRDAAKHDYDREQIKECRDAIQRALCGGDECRDTKDNIATRSGRKGKYFALAFGELLREGKLRACRITRRNKQKYDGYEWVF